MRQALNSAAQSVHFKLYSNLATNDIVFVLQHGINTEFFL